MKLGELAPAKGARRSKRRVGRGIGSGCGKTSSYGQDGQKSRSGRGKGPGFEGGQMPLTQRMPKRGFHNLFKTSYEVLNLKDLAAFEGTEVDPKILHEKGLVKKDKKVKILGTGEAPKAIIIRAHKFSKSAAEKLTAAGGKVEVL
jgi:large subunit ribosomal protein L15